MRYKIGENEARFILQDSKGKKYLLIVPLKENPDEVKTTFKEISACCEEN